MEDIYPGYPPKVRLSWRVAKVKKGLEGDIEAKF
jgi:hypothetical protein